MRNRLRVLAFDIAAPLAAIAALLYIGLALAWPLWWVSLCSVLCLLIVHGVTLGTDDDAPGLRLAVAGVAAAAVVAAVTVGYLRWTVPDRTFNNDRDEVVRIASSVSEATATFSPQSPTSSIDRATSMMSPEQAQQFKNEFANVAKELASKNVSATAATISAGVEALGPQVASVAVVLRGTQSAPGKPTDNAVMALRVALSKSDGRWLVDNVTPLHSR